MAYRDEIDALRAENQALKDELAAREEQAHIAQPAQSVYDRNANARGAATAAVIAGVGGAIGLAVAAFAVMRTPARVHREHARPDRVTAVWQATVQSVVGATVAAGTPCVVRATVGATSELPTAVSVSCGEQVLYSVDAAHLNGGSLYLSGESRLVSSDPARRTFDIAYEERGASMRAYPGIALDSRAGVAVISRDGANPMRVQLRVERESAPTR